MDKIEKLKELQGRIPAMDCMPNCNLCCGSVPWSKAEWALLPEDLRSRHTIHALRCSFVGSGRCEAYEYRTITCRLFGVTEGLPCPKGICAPKTLTKLEAAEIFKEYAEIFF